jgi:lysophospholipase L1-like esterase
MTRLLPLTTLVVLTLTVSLSSQISAAEPLAPTRSTDGIHWFDIRDLGVEGQGWTNVKAPFDRLPAKAEKTVRGAVWNLSRHSAGMAVRFVTDATSIHAHWKLTSPSLAMPHMPATGVSGLDLYVKHDGRWRWIANGRPTQQENNIRILTGIPEGTREYLLYLPLYNGVELVEVGVAEGSSVSIAPPRASGRKPIIFYGTSITHGASASRPGMVHTAILGRWLDAPVINLGFSGNGRMESEVASLMAELDVSVFVIDCLPNIGPAEVAERTEPLVRILREKHPTTPIVLVEDRSYGDSFLVTSKRERNETSRVALKAIYDRLIAAGDRNLYYIKGEGMIGTDDEGTVDTSHPNDLGFMRQAEAFRTVIEPLLK